MGKLNLISFDKKKMENNTIVVKTKDTLKDIEYLKLK